ncbi:MAG TPA: hypothetical protein VHO91_02180 [Rhodopila sp.]|nr:hypothetical protein [Rhodopila sp.]
MPSRSTSIKITGNVTEALAAMDRLGLKVEETAKETEPKLGEWIVGDDIRVIVPKVAGGGPPQNPRFPNGMDFYWRLVKADVTIPDAGLPTVTYTLNMPPYSTPQRPPQ